MGKCINNISMLNGECRIFNFIMSSLGSKIVYNCIIRTDED